jgi:hypothetical protein
MFLAPGCLSQSPAGGGGREGNRFQGKQKTIRMFLAPGCLSQSPVRGEGEENWFQGKQTTFRMFLAPGCLSQSTAGGGERTGSKVSKQQLDASCSWLHQPVTSRRRRRRELVPR